MGWGEGTSDSSTQPCDIFSFRSNLSRIPQHIFAGVIPKNYFFYFTVSCTPLRQTFRTQCSDIFAKSKLSTQLMYIHCCFCHWPWWVFRFLGLRLSKILGPGKGPNRVDSHLHHNPLLKIQWSKKLIKHSLQKNYNELH